MRIPGQSNNFTAIVPVPESYENCLVETQIFMCLPLAGIAYVSGFGGMVEFLVKAFFKNKT
jgi:hypothetical protein